MFFFKKKNEKKTTLKTYFFTGIIVTAPIAITLYLAVEFIAFIDTKVTGFIPAAYNPNNFLPYGLPGIGIILLLLLFTGIGMLTANFIGQYFMRIGLRVIGKMPVISGLYNAIRKIFETILGEDKTKAFRKAVLIEYPRRDLWTIAFLTGPVPHQIHEALNEKKLISVYVPTTPNPTSGFFLYVPQKDVKELDVSVDDALKMVLSTGIIGPKETQITEKEAVQMNLMAEKEK
ncbi:MAG: DUF502 domain-containing protein [Alphaproteobacteria bacterium]|nr:DUF502 domain-containing protein [Alphaproteobacteria bacterium]